MRLLEIDEVGTLRALDAPGTINLQALGRVSKERTTLIEWDSRYQRHYIIIQTGLLAGKVVTNEMLNEYSVECPQSGTRFEDSAALFSTYSDAVSTEIDFVQAVRSMHDYLI